MRLYSKSTSPLVCEADALDDHVARTVEHQELVEGGDPEPLDGGPVALGVDEDPATRRIEGELALFVRHVAVDVEGLQIAVDLGGAVGAVELEHTRVGRRRDVHVVAADLVGEDREAADHPAIVKHQLDRELGDHGSACRLQRLLPGPAVLEVFLDEELVVAPAHPAHDLGHTDAVRAVEVGRA